MVNLLCWTMTPAPLSKTNSVIKEESMLKVQGNDILDTETGKILGSTKPKFSGWMYTDYVKEFETNKQLRFLEPMTAQELDHDALEAYIANNTTVAEEKFDGHRGLIFFTEKGNRMFSRRVSKETGWFSENTDQMPHIRDIKVSPEFYGTVIDGEVLLPVKNCSCREVQSVTGALPETAIKNQLEKGFAFMKAFDILYYKGVNIQAMPYWKRKIYLWKLICETKSPFIEMCSIYCSQETLELLRELWGDEGKNGLLGVLNPIEDYDSLFRSFLKQGKEGLIIKDIYARYEQKRTKSFVKMKAHLTYDVVIMGYEEPTKVYEGKEIDNWEYWIDNETGKLISPSEMTIEPCEEAFQYGYTPVTKFYAMGWIGAIKFGVWKDYDLHELISLGYSGEYFDELERKGIIKCKGKVGQSTDYKMLVVVGQTSGLDEATRKLISENKQDFLGRVIEVEAQRIINKTTGSLQHPRFICFRDDKSSEMCTFEAHIRKYEEDK